MSSKNKSNTSIKPFLIQLGLLSVFAFAGLYFWQQYASLRFQTHLGWLIVFFFTVVTIATHTLLLKAADESPKKFIMYFMTLTGVRLFGYLIIILVYALIKREAALGFTILFLIMYFLYTAFEVIALLKLLKKENGRSNTNDHLLK